MTKRWLIAGAMALALSASVPSPSFAAQTYPDKDTPYTNIGTVVIDCLDSSGKAVPMTSGNCAGTVPTSGGSGGGAVTQGTTPWVDDITQLGNVTLGGATAWGVAPTGNVIGVNANNLTLPPGAATSANQTTEINSLATIASNSSAALPTQAPTVSIGGTGIIDSAGTNVANVKAASTAPALTDTALVVALASNGDPCIGQKKTNVAIATSSGNVQLVAGVSSKKVYVCSIAIIGATAWVGNLIEGTGAACTTANEAAVMGSTTAASGMSFPATGGMTYGNGGNTVASSATAANGLCLLQSGTAALAGNISYVQQ